MTLQLTFMASQLRARGSVGRSDRRLTESGSVAFTRPETYYTKPSSSRAPRVSESGPDDGQMENCDLNRRAD
eukprot:g66628.t1